MKHAESVLVKQRLSAPSSQIDFSGQWKNELGSSMVLSIEGSQVTGTYLSAVSAGDGPVEAPLYGSVTGDLISFSVNWGNSITSWVGHGIRENDQDGIVTLWHLVAAIPDETNPQSQWKTVYAGADSFTRILSGKKQTPL
jgi:Avidin family